MDFFLSVQSLIHSVIFGFALILRQLKAGCSAAAEMQTSSKMCSPSHALEMFGGICWWPVLQRAAFPPDLSHEVVCFLTEEKAVRETLLQVIAS